MPLLDEAIVRQMISISGPDTGVVPYVDGSPQPITSIYTPRCLEPAMARLAREALSAGDWAEECVQAGLCLRWDVAAKQRPLFDNWNVPADMPENIRQENHAS